jgi:hypothetical protein
MNRLACLNPTCRGHHHHDTCPGDCQGCAPRPAADGVQLCQYHTDKIPDDARQLATLYHELAQRLLGGQGLGDKVSGTPGPRLPDPRAVEIRTEIRHTLAGWSRVIEDSRGFALPPDNINSVAAYVARSGLWLAASDYADEVSQELRSLVARAWTVAYPSGAHTVHIGPCIQPDCPGILRAVVRRADSLLPSEVVCDADDTHRWTPTQWHTLGRAMRKAA